MAAEKRIYTNLTRAFITPERVRRLNLNGKGMHTVHANILRFSHLHHLNLNHNELETVPAAVCERIGLEELLLQDSSIEQLPQAIDSFQDLRELYLQHSSINRFPASLVCMNTREVLIVRGNLNAPESRHWRGSALPQTWIGWDG